MFYVDERVLIPRPETELLVEWVLPEIRKESIVLDVGAGSGCIAITIALETGATVLSSDTSPDALAVASENARRLGASVHFLLADQATALRDGCLDVLVSNPPYVAESSRSELQPEVVRFEPEAALFSGDDGLDAIRSLVLDAKRVLKPGGLLAFELGGGQAEAVSRVVPGGRILRDLAGRDRVCLARLLGSLGSESFTHAP
jgi:release factor glutamine methyltransferase